MSITKFKLWLGAFLMLAATVPVAQAQILTEAENAPHTGPFIEPDTFKSDLQFFAPAEVDDYSGPPQPNVGFYFKYQYMQVMMARPRFRTEPGAAPTDLFPLTPVNSVGNQVVVDQNGMMDSAPGNKWSFGWVDDEGVGWHGVCTTVRSPAIHDEDPFRLINLKPWNQVRATMNDQSYQSYELNRSLWRATLSHGGTFEPFLGMRYMRIADKTEFRSASSLEVGGAIEEAWLQQTKVDNEILLGQLGFRHTRRSGHWQFSTEGRFFVGNNYQRYRGYQREEFRTYGQGTGTVIGKQGLTDPETSYDPFNSRTITRKNEELLWGGELDLNAEYQVTKYCSLTFGGTFFLTDGAVGRARLATYGQTINVQRPANFLQGAEFVANDKDYLRFGGVMFGINFNR